MGSSYYIYTEALIDGRWMCICPYVVNMKKLNKNPNNKQEALTMMETYWNQSRSYFGETYEKIREIGEGIEFSKLSQELREIFKDDEWCVITSLSYNDLKKYTPSENEYDHCGYVPKSAIFKFEHDDDEIWEWLTVEDYRQLPDDEKGYYKLYEWDDEMGWAVHLKQIKRNVAYNIGLFDDTNFGVLDFNNIRVIMIAYP